MSKTNYLSDVRAQYEHLPYPQRNPADEKLRLLETKLDFLPRLNHYCFAGNRDFNQPFAVLVAGGGTGDAVIYLAEQLRNTPAQICYIDISTASMQIAQQRAAVRGLNNITWLNASLLDLTPDSHGPFDYINCSGVLHHLAQPLTGLQCLKSVLAPGGAMGIMVYAKYGRTAVYQIQELMRLINTGQMSIPEKIDNTHKVFDSLPPTNWWKRAEELHTDHITYGDIGLYDLLLHSQDRAYSIPELHDWLQQAGLRFIDFAGTRLLYEPRNYIQDRQLASLVIQKPVAQQQAIAELMSGAISKHSFYCTAGEPTVAALTDQSIPVFADADLRRDIIEQMQPAQYGNNYLFRKQRLKFTLPINEVNATVFKLMDGLNTLQDILARTIDLLSLNAQQGKELSRQLHAVCELFMNADEIYLTGSSYIGLSIPGNQ